MTVFTSYIFISNEPVAGSTIVKYFNIKGLFGFMCNLHGKIRHIDNFTTVWTWSPLESIYHSFCGFVTTLSHITSRDNISNTLYNVRSI